MANVSDYVEQIRKAVYGEQVRGSIANAIEAMNSESTQALSNSSAAVSTATNAVSEANSARAAANSSAQAAENSATSAAASASQSAASATAAEASKQDADDALSAAEAARDAAQATADSLSHIEEDDEALFNQFLSTLRGDYDSFEQGLDDDFMEWWDNVRVTIDDNVALNLQNQIDAITELTETKVKSIWDEVMVFD